MRKGLRKLRRDMEYTQEQMGQLMNLSRQAYTNVELGKRFPSQDRWEMLFDKLNIPDERKYLLMKNE
jgi:DNA-binding XRE family transcriptional regulator